MKGCRPLTDTEIQGVLDSFKGENRLRNRCLVLLGIKAGFRISELLSLRVRDVFQAGKVPDRVEVTRQHMKAQIESRSVVLHQMAKEAISERIGELASRGQGQPESYLFRSQRGGNAALGRIGGWCVLKKAYKTLSLTGRVSCHSLRKSFASRVYDKLDHDLVKTQKALGHKNIQSTVAYLNFRQEDIDSAVLAI